MEVGHDPHYNIAQAQSTSNKSDIFFSQSGVILFRASNKSDNFFSQSGVLLFRASNKSDNFFSQSGVILFRASNESDNFSANQFAPQTKAIIFQPISSHLKRKR
jgi:hypothetical protein